MTLQKYSVVLASGSPRRRELLASLTEFEVLAPNVDETLIPGESLKESTTRLAAMKAREVWRLMPDCVIIAADTLVGFDDTTLLGKPADSFDAIAMLGKLSGRSHQVVTGVALRLGQLERVFAEETSVTFRSLATEEIEQYVETGEPLDKAGAYAIQGGAASFVASIRGSMSNVIGLPMERLTSELEQLLVEAT